MACRVSFPGLGWALRWKYAVPFTGLPEIYCGSIIGVVQCLVTWSPEVGSASAVSGVHSGGPVPVRISRQCTGTVVVLSQRF